MTKNLQLVGTREVPDQPSPTSVRPPKTRAPRKKKADPGVISAAITMGLGILNARLLMFVALTIGGALGYLAVSDPNWGRIAALTTYELGIFLPLAGLAWFRG
jgi:hypothetical protein